MKRWIAVLLVLAGCEKRLDKAAAASAVANLAAAQPSLATLHELNWGEAPKGYKACTGTPPSVILDSLFLLELDSTGLPTVPGPQPLFRSSDTTNLQKVLMEVYLGKAPKITEAQGASISAFATSPTVAVTVLDAWDIPRLAEGGFTPGLLVARVYVVDRTTGAIACQSAYFARSSEKVTSMAGTSLQQKAIDSDFVEQNELAARAALARMFSGMPGTNEKLALGVLRLAAETGEKPRALLDAPDLAERVANLGDAPTEQAPAAQKPPALPKEKGLLDGIDGILAGKTVYLQPDGGYSDTPPPMKSLLDDPPKPKKKKK